MAVLAGPCSAKSSGDASRHSAAFPRPPEIVAPARGCGKARRLIAFEPFRQTSMKTSPFWLCTAFSEEDVRAGRARKYSANLTTEVCAKYREEGWVARERQRLGCTGK